VWPSRSQSSERVVRALVGLERRLSVRDLVVKPAKDSKAAAIAL
jgi:hypothetical protein